MEDVDRTSQAVSKAEAEVTAARETATGDASEAQAKWAERDAFEKKRAGL